MSINVSTGFCHEPDHVQLILGKNLTEPVSGGGGWSASSASASAGSSSVTGSASAASMSAVATSYSLPTSTSGSSSSSSSSNFHRTSSCDKLLWPNFGLNVTTSAVQASSWSAEDDLNATNLRGHHQQRGSGAGQAKAAVVSTEFAAATASASEADPSTSEGVNLIVALSRWLGFNDEENSDADQEELATVEIDQEAFTSSGAKGVLHTLPKRPRPTLKSWTTQEQSSSLHLTTMQLTSLTMVIVMQPVVLELLCRKLAGEVNSHANGVHHASSFEVGSAGPGPR